MNQFKMFSSLMITNLSTLMNKHAPFNQNDMKLIFDM